MAQPRLKQYFPMIRTREQVLDDIQSNILLNTKFRSLSEERQTEFIDICTGERGVKILYNSYFKTVMDPKKYPERVKSLLECILVKEIVSYEVLESSSFSLGDEKSLVIMDIVVEHIDGTIINLEIQKIGYDFPGERAACYASDLTIRQYVHAKNFAAELPPENPGHRFSYRSIRPVYTIVLIEQSTAIFSKFPDTYIHRFSQMSDSGLSMNLLHHYIFIPLDIFKKTHQNGDVSTKLDAWLMFLSTDEPNKIMRLVDKFPEFLALYRHIYEICANTEDIMGIFSEALAEMDRNTVDYMIDEMQKKKDQLQSENDQLQSENDQLQSENDQLQSENDQLQSENDQLQQEKDQIQQEKDQIQQQNDQLQIENELLKQKLYELQNQSTSNSQ